MTTSGVGGTESTQETPPTESAPPAPGGKGGTISGSVKAGTLEELKAVAPEVYEKTMEGIALTICNESKKHTENLKKEMRKGRSG